MFTTGQVWRFQEHIWFIIHLFITLHPQDILFFFECQYTVFVFSELLLLDQYIIMSSLCFWQTCIVLWQKIKWCLCNVGSHGWEVTCNRYFTRVTS